MSGEENDGLSGEENDGLSGEESDDDSVRDGQSKHAVHLNGDFPEHDILMKSNSSGKYI